MAYKPPTDADDLYDNDYRLVVRNPEIKFHFLGKTSVKEGLNGVILPSFDFDVDPVDTTFMDTVAPMWTNTRDKDHARDFAPSGWALPLLTYAYLGETKENWLSPRNKLKLIGGDSLPAIETADAFDDLAKSIRQSDLSEDQKNFFLKGAYPEDPLVPTPSVRWFTQCYMQSTKDPWHVGIVSITSGARQYIIEQARWQNRQGDTQLDANFPQYMLGDVTRPEYSMKWKAMLRGLHSRNGVQDTNIMAFTTATECLDPTIDAIVVPKEILDQRVLLHSIDTWVFPTYQEQVDHMVAHYPKEVTREMIQRACGELATVGERPSPASASTQPERGSSMDPAAAIAAVTGGAPVTPPVSMAPASTVTQPVTPPAQPAQAAAPAQPAAQPAAATPAQPAAQPAAPAQPAAAQAAAPVIQASAQPAQAEAAPAAVTHPDTEYTAETVYANMFSGSPVAPAKEALAREVAQEAYEATKETRDLTKLPESIVTKLMDVMS